MAVTKWGNLGLHISPDVIWKIIALNFQAIVFISTEERFNFCRLIRKNGSFYALIQMLFQHFRTNANKTIPD